MTRTEPVMFFSGLAAAVGLLAHWLLPDAAIPDELIVAVVFGIALAARRFVTPVASLPDAEVLEHARRAVKSRRGGPAAGAVLAALLLWPSGAPASGELHCEEWPHWAKAYAELNGYGGAGGPAVDWLRLAGCPPTWADGRWLPNGSECDTPCEAVRADESLDVAPDPPAADAEADAGTGPVQSVEVTIVEPAPAPAPEPAADRAGCACTLQVRSGAAGQCYAPPGVTPSEWTHVTSLGDAGAVWLSPRRGEGQFRTTGRGSLVMSYLLDGERVQCETVRVTQSAWQRAARVVTDPRVVISAAGCMVGVIFGGGALCGM